MNCSISTAVLIPDCGGNPPDRVDAPDERGALVPWVAKLPSFKVILHNLSESELLAAEGSHLWRVPFAMRTRKLLNA